MLNRIQSEAISDIAAALTLMEKKFNRTALDAAKEALQRLLLSDVQARANISNAARGNKYRAGSAEEAEFALSFRSTGAWRTVTGWAQLAETLRMAESSCRVRVGAGKGQLSLNYPNPNAADNLDVLYVEHTNRKHRKRGTPIA